MRKFLLYPVLILIPLLSISQVKKELVTDVEVQNTKAVFLGKTKAIKDLIHFESTDIPKKSVAKKNKAVPENFFGRGKSKSIITELEHQGVDPLWQKSIPGSKLRFAGASDPIVNVDGLSNGFSPHDPSGDVGINYYIQAVNATKIGVFNKSDGSLVSSFNGNSLWSPLGESSAGDPIIIFDHEFNRWIITEFTSPSGTASILFAISETGDPLGSYNVYVFVPPSFPDYPKYGLWKNTYIVTTNESGPGTLHQYFFDRDALLAGEEDVTFQRVVIGGNSNTEASFYVSTPVHWLGDLAPVDDNPMAIKINDSSWGEVAEDAIEIFTFDVDFISGTTVTKTTLVSTPFDSYPCDNESGGFACLSQGGSESGIDAIPEVVMNMPQYRNFGTHESIVMSFITDVSDGDNLSGIRWTELRRTSEQDWFIYQEGTFAPEDGLHRFMSSISIDKTGNIALAYNVSGPNEFVGIRYTGRYANDELGIMTLPEVNVISGTNSIGGDRFGDYAQMSVDPVDERTFWYTTEYATGGTGMSTTRIVAFQLEKNQNDLEITSILNPTSGSLSNAENVTVKVTNRGIESATNFDLKLTLNGSLVETYTHTGNLGENGILEHTFNTSLDLSAFGENEIVVSLSYDLDEVAINDLFSTIVETFAQLNGGVQLSASPEVCGENVAMQVTLTNEGVMDLETANIEVTVNGTFSEVISWTGSLVTNESEIIEIMAEDLASGINTVSVSLKNPNGGTDQVLDDNDVDFSFQNNLSLDQISLQINSDDFPSETTWEITNDANEVVFSGGPYTAESSQIFESFCVDSDECYTFTIFDSFGDGICCGEDGDGSYTLVGVGNETIFEGDGEFGNVEATSFCTGSICNLVIIANKSDADATQGGSIIFNSYGSYGYNYSVDGGTTFQEGNMFSDLEAGTYEVVVESQNGNCVHTETIEISYILGLGDEIISGLSIGPNPTTGLFRMSLTGHDYIQGFLQVQVLDLNGKIIQQSKFSRYDDAFEGTISLYAYPEGIYFLRLLNVQTNKMIKIIKN